MRDLIPITSPADIAQVKSTLDRGLSTLPDTLEFSMAPASGKITLSYGASRLIALGGSNLSGRTKIIVTNLGPCQIRLSGSSSESAIYENGYPVEPGQTVILNVGSSISVYGRSTGYKTVVEVTEA